MALDLNEHTGLVIIGRHWPELQRSDEDRGVWSRCGLCGQTLTESHAGSLIQFRIQVAVPVTRADMPGRLGVSTVDPENDPVVLGRAASDAAPGYRLGIAYWLKRS